MPFGHLGVPGQPRRRPGVAQQRVDLVDRRSSSSADVPDPAHPFAQPQHCDQLVVVAVAAAGPAPGGQVLVQRLLVGELFAVHPVGVDQHAGRPKCEFRVMTEIHLTRYLSRRTVMTEAHFTPYKSRGDRHADGEARHRLPARDGVRARFRNQFRHVRTLRQIVDGRGLESHRGSHRPTRRRCAGAGGVRHPGQATMAARGAAASPARWCCTA